MEAQHLLATRGILGFPHPPVPFALGKALAATTDPRADTGRSILADHLIQIDPISVDDHGLRCRVRVSRCRCRRRRLRERQYTSTRTKPPERPQAPSVALGASCRSTE